MTDFDSVIVRSGDVLCSKMLPYDSPVDKVEVTLVSRAEDSTLDTPGREEHLMPWLNDILHKGSADES